MEFEKIVAKEFINMSGVISYIKDLLGMPMWCMHFG